MFTLFKTESIEFLCEEDDYGIIAEPYPARKLMPDWYKALPMTLEPGIEKSTIKRCNPFLDSMSLGWIIPLAADVEIQTNHDCSSVDYKWKFYKPMIENHGMEQITTSKKPNPTFPKPPMKFMNFWITKCPEDYSLLFVPPLNRPDPRFTCFSGLVDSDKYFEYVNFPFIFNVPNYHGIIKAGTPLIQVIPIKRDKIIKKSITRPMNFKEIDQLNKTRRHNAAKSSYYREYLWEKK
jgi:hypothetical protein